MQKKETRIAMKKAEQADFIATKENQLSDEKAFFRKRMDAMQAKDAYIFLAVVGSGANDDSKKKKEFVKPKRLTLKEKAAIKAETKKELKAMGPLLLPPYTVIIPAPGLGKMKPSELCTYCGDKFPRIDAVPDFSNCFPSTGFCSDIYDNLLPLASIGKGISSEDRISMNIYTKQLSDNFGATINSIANICNGNPKLFSLIRVKTRKKAARNNKRLGAPVVTLSDKKGAETIGVKCKPIKFAKSYTVTYWINNDKTTMITQVGNSSQLIENLTGGDLVSIIVCANSGKLAGFPSNVQSIRVPYS